MLKREAGVLDGFCTCVDSETQKVTRTVPPEACTNYISISGQYYGQMEDWIADLISRIKFKSIRARAEENVSAISASVQAVQKQSEQVSQ